MIDVAAAIIEKEGKVLAARRKQGCHMAGFWAFPGGKIEPGETLAQCLRRELEEEFCIKAEVGEKVGENIHHYDTISIRLIPCKATHISGDFELIDHDKIVWLAPEKLNSLEWAPADIPLIDCYLAQLTTQSYYQQNAQLYTNETKQMSIAAVRNTFLEQVNPGGHLLDLGCGSGRDSKWFIEAGYAVTPLDGSAELAALATEYIGHPVVVMPFQAMDFDNEFDGIWACASLLHCPKSQMKDVMQRVMTALKPGGVVFASFKWGNEETVDAKGRFINNYTEDSLRVLLEGIETADIIRLWSETSILRDAEQRWVSVLIRKEFN